MALDTTVGGASANSYASVAEADAYNAARLHVSSWDDATTATKEAALKWAALLLDSNPRAWTGSPVGAVQALGWPRSGMFNRNGFVILTTIIPVELKQAQSEFARQLIETDRTADNAIINQGINRIKAGSVEIGFQNLVIENSELVARSIRELNALAAVLPDAVKYLLVQSWLLPDEEDVQNTTLVFEVD